VPAFGSDPKADIELLRRINDRRVEAERVAFHRYSPAFTILMEMVVAVSAVMLATYVAYSIIQQLTN
jgi:hypothetical protein